MKDYIVINYKWLQLQDYQFKMLILIKMLATDKEQITYTGTLQDIRQWLHLTQNKKNNNAIIKAIEELSNNNIITYTLKGRKYNITIIDKPKNDIFAIERNVDKQDIETIRNYVIDNNKRILGNMLKIFIFSLGNSEIITYVNLGLLLNIITIEDIDNKGEYRTNKISYAINALEQCNFKDNTYFKIQRKYFVDVLETGKRTYKGLGTEITVNKQFK